MFLYSSGVYFCAYHKGQLLFENHFQSGSSGVYLCAAGFGSKLTAVPLLLLFLLFIDKFTSYLFFSSFYNALFTNVVAGAMDYDSIFHAEVGEGFITLDPKSQ